MLYKCDFYTLTFEKVPTVGGVIPPPPSHTLPPLGRFAPSPRTSDKMCPLRDFAPPKLKVFRCAWGGGGGGVISIGGRTRCSRKNGGKGVSKSGVGAERAIREKGVNIAKNRGKRGIQIAMISVLAMRSNLERV